MDEAGHTIEQWFSGSNALFVWESWQVNSIKQVMDNG